MDDLEWELRAVKNAPAVLQEAKEREGGRKQEKEEADGYDEEQEKDETIDAREGERCRLCAFPRSATAASGGPTYSANVAAVLLK